MRSWVRNHAAPIATVFTVLSVVAAAAVAQGAVGHSPVQSRPTHRAVGIPAAATATNVQCGQTLTASVTLNGDLYCSGRSGSEITPALTITGNNVVLNLNGHHIEGDINLPGVQIEGKTDTVENGSISNVLYGVVVQGSAATVSGLQIRFEQGYGIEVAGSGAKITNDVIAGILGETLAGIFVSGTGTLLAGDREVSANQGLSIGETATSTTVTSNIATSNGGYGILDQGTGTTLTKNTADFNGKDGIYVDDGDMTAADGGGNLAKGNDLITGTRAEQCYGVACT